MLIRKLVTDAMKVAAHVLTITGESMSDVRMTTTDNYQGEESDLVSTAFMSINLPAFQLSALTSAYQVHDGCRTYAPRIQFVNSLLLLISVYDF